MTKFVRCLACVLSLWLLLSAGCSGADGAGLSGGGGDGTLHQGTGGGRVASGGAVEVSGGVGAMGSGGLRTGGLGTGGAETGAVAPSGGAGDLATGGAMGSGGESPPARACDPGTTDTAWASQCRDTSQTCAPGSWQAPSEGSDGHPLRAESEHFALYWFEADPDGSGPLQGLANPPSQATIDGALSTLESLWGSYFGHPIYFAEPYCDSTTKWKAAVHVDDFYPLWGGGFGDGKMGLWIGNGALMDKWGLAHEFMHGVQSTTQAFPDCGGNGCWIFESHANWMPHQIYRENAHCSELLVNAPHLYYGNTRDRYCNWQFFEFIKNKHCYAAINEMWSYVAPSGQADPFEKLMASRGWDIEMLNDEFGQWAMHNVTWDYKDPPPTSGADQGAVYRTTYGSMLDPGDRPERQNRLARLEALDDDFASNHRFVSSYYGAPQRWGYNIVELIPEAGVTEVSVIFRGVIQDGAHSGFRWGLLASNADNSVARYGQLQRGTDGRHAFCVEPGEHLFLVVTAAPTEYVKIPWTQPGDGPAHPSLYRYPYMVELEGAWPAGFEGGQRADCPAGTVRHANGGGCATPETSASVYVGPYARVLGGVVSGDARIEDHATIARGDVSGGTVGGLTIVGTRDRGFTVSGSPTVRTSFLPLGWFGGTSISGEATVVGDAEYNTSVSSGFHYGLVDGTARTPVDEVTTKPPYTFRP